MPARLISTDNKLQSYPITHATETNTFSKPLLYLWSQNFMTRIRIPTSVLDWLLSWSIVPHSVLYEGFWILSVEHCLRQKSLFYFFHTHSSIFYLLPELLYKPINLSPYLKYFPTPIYLMQICKINPSKVQL